MKTIEQLLDCIEDDIELMGENRIVYLMEDGDKITDYDYLPSDLYTEAMQLKDLKAEISQAFMNLKQEKVISESNNKLAVIFPGVGYTCDKPLLYYSRKMVEKLGYKVITLSYSGIPENIKNNPALKRVAFENALSSVKEHLSVIDMNQYDDVLFISKSVGTIVSSAYAHSLKIPVRNVMYTPVEETFRFAKNPSVAFHGTSDDWADTDTLIKMAAKLQIPLYLTKDANHSLETGDLDQDLSNMQLIMSQTRQFILGI